MDIKSHRQMIRLFLSYDTEHDVQEAVGSRTLVSPAVSLEQIQTDSTQVSGLWGKIFVKREETTKGDYIASLIANGMTVIDLILLYRKLRRNYGGLTSLFSGSKKKHKH